MEKPERLSRALRWLGKALHRWLPRPDANVPLRTPANTTQRGHAAETRALHHLQAAGLELLARNWRSPGRGGGEIDLIMRAPDGSLVFVEVRSRRQSGFGGAAGSIGATKQRRIVRAARHWLLRHGLAHAPCRFDVVLIEGGALHWHQGAFDAPPA